MDTAPIFRRRSPAGGLVGLFTLLGLLVAARSPAQTGATAPAAAALTPPKLIEALAREAAEREFPQLSEHQRMVVGPIEPHAELAKCQAPIRAMLSSAHHMQDRATFEVRCTDLNGWHLYVPVRIVGISSVAVAVHAMVIGEVIKEEDLKVEQHDVSELPLGFIDEPKVAVGLTVSRPIAGGAYLTNQQLVASKAVQRGQMVTLVADAGGMSVSMAGRALTDGLVNQRVRVTNLSSGKVVEGIARSEQVVEIILQ